MFCTLFYVNSEAQHTTRMNPDELQKIQEDMQIRLKIIELMSNPSVDKDTIQSNLNVAKMYLQSLSENFYFRVTVHS